MRAAQVLAGWAGEGTVVLPGDRYALSGTGDALTLWELGHPPRAFSLQGHRGPVAGVAVSPTGHLAVSGSHDGSVLLWNLETARPVRRFIGHRDMVGPVAFAPLQDRVVSGSRDSRIVVWDIRTGRPLHTLTGHRGPVNGLAVTPDARHLVSTSVQDRSLRLWRLADGALLASFQGESQCSACALAPDGRTVVTGARTGGVEVFRLEV